MKSEIDLVYILGNGSKWYDNEIRFSLRSAERYFKYRHIFVIGEKPSWMQGVIYIKAEDSERNKLMNARNKYLVACNDERVSEDFVLMNDDFFFLREVETIENYSRGTLQEMIEKHPTKGGYYYESLQKTRDRLKQIGIENPIDFEVHAPIIFNKKKLIEIIKFVGEEPYSLRSCYGNITGMEPKKVMDYKAASMAEFSYQTKDEREFLSTSDGLVHHDEFKMWIERKFKNPSKFENDEKINFNNITEIKSRYFATKTFKIKDKTYNPGEIIDNRTMEELRAIETMREYWTFK